MNLLELTWPEIAAQAPDTPVVLPIAALEQHGRHMPVFTDSLLLGEVIRRAAAEAVGDRVLFAPLMWLGNSEHHLDFAGTFSAAPRTYLDLLNDMVENLLTHGFRRIVLINGHGGNIVPSQQALFEVRQRHRRRDDLLLLATTYWTLGAAPHETPGHDWQQQQMGHAGEWETSMMLCIRPDLVKPHEQLPPIPATSFAAGANRAWITRERTEAGHIGFPHAATAAKGELLLNLFSADVVRLLDKAVAWDGSGGG